MAAVSPFSEEAMVSLVGGEDAVNDSFFYLCGRLLSKKEVVLPSFSAAISNIWEVKERVLIRQEEEDILVFQFKEMEVKNRILSGGPWFYNNSMLLLADYDGISALDTAPLHLLEVWVDVKGLRIAMRNEKALTLIGPALGDFVRVDQGAMLRKDPVQRIRVIQDVRRRIWPRRMFEFSPVVSVTVELQYEKCHGLCAACGFFGHEGGSCDRRLAEEAPLLVVPGRGDLNCGLDSAPRSEASVAAVVGPEVLFKALTELGFVTAGAGEAVVAEGGPASGAASSAAAVLEKPAGNPNFELGLTAGLTRMQSGLQSFGPDEGSNGLSVGLAAGKNPKLGLGVRKKVFKPSLAFIPPEFHLGELVEVPISMGTAQKKKGRPYVRRAKRMLSPKAEGNKAGVDLCSNSNEKELFLG
ncbi:uncharacterized protein LOC121050625 [Rosa chinensis]|uniref:uncharacterized protein LOC121050625 n=1 Tax=Rosa chinensis TaxID=74649 RepID=UPI001AD90E16|nr:uncharacterized protein LOC121050625 [Rosa chinensis]